MALRALTWSGQLCGLRNPADVTFSQGKTNTLPYGRRVKKKHKTNLGRPGPITLSDGAEDFRKGINESSGRGVRTEDVPWNTSKEKGEVPRSSSGDVER